MALLFNMQNWLLLERENSMELYISLRVAAIWLITHLSFSSQQLPTRAVTIDESEQAIT